MSFRRSRLLIGVVSIIAILITSILTLSHFSNIDDDDSLGLLNRDGTPKLAYNAWSAISSSVG